MPPKKSKQQAKAEDPDTAEPAPGEEEIEPIDVSKVEKNTLVMCKYTGGMYYEAKVIDVSEKGGERVFTVHYSGWNKRYDEKIPESDAQARFREHKTELVEHFKKVQKEATAKPSRKSMAATTSSDKADRESSRGSTPAARGTPRAASSLSTTDAGTPVPKQPRRTGQLEQPVREAVRKEGTPVVLFTESLRNILTDDQDYITRQKKLLKVPARFTVAAIIAEYIQSIGDMDDNSSVVVEYSAGMNLTNPSKQTLKENAVGLLDYFDATIGSLLLYKFERPQYSDLYESMKEKLTPEQREKIEQERTLPQTRAIRLSSQYGFVHLLRMFVRLGEILSYAPWSPRAMETIMKHAQDLVLFLSKKVPEYYDPKLDYTDAPPEYEKRVWGSHA